MSASGNTVVPHRLLRVLDDIVKSDRAPARLDGSVVVAVKSQDGASYWHAAFAGDRVLGCGYLKGLPRDADAVMLFDDEQASDVLIGDSPEGKVVMFGDHDLLGAFVSRYCEFKSAIDIRVSR